MYGFDFDFVLAAGFALDFGFVRGADGVGAADVATSADDCSRGGFASNPSPPPRSRPLDRVREETDCSGVAAGVAAGVADVDVGVLFGARRMHGDGLTAVAF